MTERMEPTSRLRSTPELSEICRWIDDGGYTDWLVEAWAEADDLWEWFRDVPVEDADA